MNEVKRHSAGMVVIGGLVWLLYLGYTNLMTLVFDQPHFVGEISGIPLTWLMNYSLNTLLNFRQPLDARRLFSFCVISSVGWMFFLLTTYVCTDVLGWHSSIGPVIGVAVSTAMNVVMQQAITFGYLGEQKKEEAYSRKAIAPDYDWNAYYNGNPIQKYWKRQVSQKAIAMIGVDNPVLEVGCGSSPNLSMLPVKEKIGVEMDAGKVEFMRKKDTTSQYRQGVGESMPDIADGYCSAVMCLEVIEHHPHPYLLVKEIARVVKGGGKVVIATPDFSSPLWNMIEVAYGLLMKRGYHEEHGMKFTESAVKALCEGVGLEWVRTDSILGADLVMEFRKVGRS